VYSSSQGCHTATGTHMPHGITQCYLPPGRDHILAFTPARLVVPGTLVFFLRSAYRSVVRISTIPFWVITLDKLFIHVSTSTISWYRSCPMAGKVTFVLASHYYYYFESAAVAVDSSHITVSSSASWSRFSPPSNFINRHVSTMWFMVCRWP